MEDWQLMAIMLCIFVFMVYGTVNAVLVFSCLASEGNVTWNKAVFACHFDDSTSIITQQIISSSHSQSIECYQNGVKTNCSSLGNWTQSKANYEINHRMMQEIEAELFVKSMDG